MPLTTIGGAIQAYSNAAKNFGVGGGAGSEPVGPQTSDFGSLVKQGLESAIGAGKQSETMSKQALAGKADVRDVVSAVNNAELTLETVVAVRDKVITAYNDILKMPI